MRILVLAPNTPGLASEDLITYLEGTEHALDVMKHPVAPTAERITTFSAGDVTVVRGKRIVPLTYRTDVALTQELIQFRRRRHHRFSSRPFVQYDWVICLSPHLALAGLKLRKSGLVKKVVYWALDYYPTRYGKNGVISASGFKAWAGLIAEKMYRNLESKVVRESDVRWVVTDGLVEGWRSGGYTWPLKGASSRPTTVPHAITNVRTPIPFAERVFKQGLVWTGMLRPEFGFDVVLEAWPQLKAMFPEIFLQVTSRSGIPDRYEQLLGKSPYDAIKYLGFRDTKKKMEGLIAHSGSALGLYLPGSYKQYSDGARIKSYAACGVPVITTSAIGSAKDVKEFGAGFVIEPTVFDLIDSVHSLLSDAQLNDAMSAGAHALAESCTADKVFSKALESLV